MNYKLLLPIFLITTLLSCSEESKEYSVDDPAASSSSSVSDTMTVLDTLIEETDSLINSEEPNIKNENKGIPYEMIVGNWKKDSIRTSDGEIAVWEPNEYVNDPVALNLRKDSTFVLSMSGALVGPVIYDGVTLELVNLYQDKNEVEFRMEVVSIDNSVLVLKHIYSKHGGSSDVYWSYFSKYND